MIEALDELRAGFGNLSRRLQRLKARHVNAASDKETVRRVVGQYFREVRPRLANFIQSEAGMASLDKAMQDLLRCAQRRARVSQYRELVRACQSALNEVELRGLRTLQVQAASFGFRQREQRILETLRKVNPSAALSYEQGLADLADADRKSLRGTVVEFREALREIVDTLVPDDEVKAQSGFQLEPGAKGPTMKQKTAFILRRRRLAKSQARVAEDAVGVVEEAVGRFVRSVYDRASTGVHTQPTKDEVLQIKQYVTTVLGELLEVPE